MEFKPLKIAVLMPQHPLPCLPMEGSALPFTLRPEGLVTGTEIFLLQNSIIWFLILPFEVTCSMEPVSHTTLQMPGYESDTPLHFPASCSSAHFFSSRPPSTWGPTSGQTSAIRADSSTPGGCAPASAQNNGTIITLVMDTVLLLIQLKTTLALFGSHDPFLATSKHMVI